MKIACASLLFAAAGVQSFTSPLVNNNNIRSSSTALSVKQSDLDGAQSMIDGILAEKNCGPVFVRLAWQILVPTMLTFPTPNGPRQEVPLVPSVSIPRLITVPMPAWQALLKFSNR